MTACVRALHTGTFCFSTRTLPSSMRTARLPPSARASVLYGRSLPPHSCYLSLGRVKQCCARRELSLVTGSSRHRDTGTVHVLRNKLHAPVPKSGRVRPLVRRLLLWTCATSLPAAERPKSTRRRPSRPNFAAGFVLPYAPTPTLAPPTEIRPIQDFRYFELF